MEKIIVKYIKEMELERPIFIEGLPGVGNVGKLAAEHLIDELDAVLLAEIYSIYFPPQVLVNEDGVTELVGNRLYYAKEVGPEKRDVIILTGDYQGMTPQGQYVLTDKLLKICSEFNVETIYALGGYGQGSMVSTPRVLGAASSIGLVEEAKEHGVVFDREHPASGIVGASGLLLGLGDKIYGISGLCLMGETSGYFVDPTASREVLKILISLLNIEHISFDALDDKAEEVKELTSKVMDMDLSGNLGQENKSEHLRYIG
ncbi:MAG: proteasome assembly chaperone family protein [Thermoplasmata archaeon]